MTESTTAIYRVGIICQHLTLPAKNSHEPFRESLNVKCKRIWIGRRSGLLLQLTFGAASSLMNVCKYPKPTSTKDGRSITEARHDFARTNLPIERNLVRQ